MVTALVVIIILCALFCFCRIDPDVCFLVWHGVFPCQASCSPVWHCARLAPFFLFLVASILKELNLDWEGLILLRWWLCLHCPKSQFVAFRISIFCYAWWWLPSCFSLSQPWSTVGHSGPSFFLLPTPCSQSSGLPRLIACLAGSASLCRHTRFVFSFPSADNNT